MTLRALFLCPLGTHLVFIVDTQSDQIVALRPSIRRFVRHNIDSIAENLMSSSSAHLPQWLP